ncbi:hypothetical protein EYF80_062637 [Liparis tanakae]|uniref:Uncharacterized protein n=1 Tax=Liparis tanakae TaxID=230148 RepID=A0A4Z2EF99_9TELE|nr:hypothetical protein EYF80_062637 [Liparis tanakae]
MHRVSFMPSCSRTRSAMLMRTVPST